LPYIKKEFNVGLTTYIKIFEKRMGDELSFGGLIKEY
jgi:hypothetical protein